jgi:hypothetical protein
MSAAHKYGEDKKKIAVVALEEYKIQVKLNFMTKYRVEIEQKKFTPDMMRELDKLEKRERAGCYMMNGLVITPRECSLCQHKSCNKV